MYVGWMAFGSRGAKRSKDLAETHNGVLIQDPAWESAGMRLFPRYDGHDPLERPGGS